MLKKLTGRRSTPISFKAHADASPFQPLISFLRECQSDRKFCLHSHIRQLNPAPALSLLRSPVLSLSILWLSCFATLNSFHLNQYFLKFDTRILHNSCWNPKNNSLMAMFCSKPIFEKTVATDVMKMDVRLPRGS
jgi:hypothetical protein